MKKDIALVDGRIDRESELSLMRLGFSVIKLPPFSRLSEAVASHPDMLVLRLGERLLTLADYLEEAEETFLAISREKKGLSLAALSDKAEAEYPSDVKLNCLVIGGFVFCRPDSVSEAVKIECERLGLKIKAVKQGYPACTALKLSEEAAITSDRGMAETLREAGIRVTEIKEGGILLSPYPYGFIGGAAESFGKKVYFFGDPKKHPSGDLILEAVNAEGLEPVALSSSPLRDLGGIVFIKKDV